MTPLWGITSPREVDVKKQQKQDRTAERGRLSAKRKKGEPPGVRAILEH